MYSIWDQIENAFVASEGVIPAGQYLALMFAGGTIGGLANSLGVPAGGLVVGAEDENQFWRALFVGTSGAAALYFILIELEKLPTTWSATNVLYVFSAACIGGFAAVRMLTAVAERALVLAGEAKEDAKQATNEVAVLRREIEVRDKTIDELTSQMNLQRREVENSLSKLGIERAVTLINLAREAPGTIGANGYSESFVAQYSSKIRETSEMLKSQHQANPDDRQCTIVLGRLLRLQGQLEDAISVLTAFANRPSVSATDKADVLYNRSIYKIIIAASSPDLKEKLLGEAADDLAMSVQLRPENRSDARTDSDFNLVKDHPRFASIFR